MTKSVLLVLSGILVGCAAAGVARLDKGVAHAEGPVEQYCATTGDYNSVEALNSLVKRAAGQGWHLVGVYRPTNIGSKWEDYVCFSRPGAQ